MQKALEFKGEIVISDDQAKEIQKKLFEEGYTLRIADNEDYRKAESQILMEKGIDKDLIEK